MGRELRYFEEAGPSRAEEREATAAMGRSATKREQREFDKWAGGFSEALLDGKGEASRFLNWVEHLKAYFRREGIVNSITQARLAERTFRGKLARWWNAHTDKDPDRVLSFARLLELIRTEMIPAADPSAACLQWSGLQYEGKPEAFLKELDRLTDTYPLERSAFIQLATRPFPPEFAGQVLTADALHGKQGMTYPQLRDMIKNYLKTLSKKTKTSEAPESPETSEPDFTDEKPHRRFRRRPKLNARPSPQPPNGPRRDAGGPPHSDKHSTLGSTTSQRPPAYPVANPNQLLRPPHQNMPPANTYGALRRGKGPHPCFVCGAADHPWDPL